MDSQEHIKLWVSEFLKKHFNDIDWQKCDYGDKTYDEILKEIDE